MSLTEAVAAFRFITEEATSAIPSNGKAMMDKILAKKIQAKLGLTVKFVGSELTPDGKAYYAKLLAGTDKLQFEVRHHGKWHLVISRVSGPGASTNSPVVMASGFGPSVSAALNAMKKTVKPSAKLPNTVKEPKPQAKPPSPAAQAAPTVATGVYKGKKYQVLGYKNGGVKVELAWFSDKTKSFVVPTAAVQITGTGAVSGVQAPPKIARYFRFSTTLIKGHALKNRGVDVTQVSDPNGKNLSGAKRTQRTGGWRDRILMKFNQMSGLHAGTFGDVKTKHHVAPTMADWEAIRDKIVATGKAEAYFMVPKGWSQTALIVKVP